MRVVNPTKNQNQKPDQEKKKKKKKISEPQSDALFIAKFYVVHRRERRLRPLLFFLPFNFTRYGIAGRGPTATFSYLHLTSSHAWASSVITILYSILNNKLITSHTESKGRLENSRRERGTITGPQKNADNGLLLVQLATGLTEWRTNRHDWRKLLACSCSSNGEQGDGGGRLVGLVGLEQGHLGSENRSWGIVEV